MKKLKPAELKNLFEVMVNSLTIPSKEGLVFLVWEGLEPHERDSFSFPSNDIYSESIKDSYLEIFEHHQPLSSIWNNNDITRRNRIRNRNIYSGNDDDDYESYTRRRLDINSIIDQLFDTSGGGINIGPDSLSSISSFTSDTSDSDSSDSNSDSNGDNGNNSDSDGDNIYNLALRNRNVPRHIRGHRIPPSLLRRPLVRRHERSGSNVISLPTPISNSSYYLRPTTRLGQSTATNSNTNSDTNTNTNTNSGVTSTRFVSTERRTMTVDNNDIRTFHIISRNQNDNPTTTTTATTTTTSTSTTTNESNDNNNNNNNNNNESNDIGRRMLRLINPISPTIHLSTTNANRRPEQRFTDHYNYVARMEESQPSAPRDNARIPHLSHLHSNNHFIRHGASARVIPHSHSTTTTTTTTSTTTTTTNSSSNSNMDSVTTSS